MNIQDPDIDVLIAKSYFGEATPEEKKVLEHWSGMTKENERYVQQGFRLLEISGNNENVNVEKAWDKFKQKTGTSSAKVIPLQPANRNRFMWYAAAAILIIAVITNVGKYLLNGSGISETVTITASNETLKDTLPDQSLIVLHSGSHIKYTINESSKTRVVTLEGEAYFEVAKNKNYSFEVNTGGTRIQDIGTSFNVISNSGEVSVFVKEGIVKLFDENSEGILVNAGELGRYNKSKKEYTKESAHNSNPISYFTREFEFNDASLKQVISELNKAYASGISLENENLGDCKITVRFSKEDIDTILDVICETLNLTRRNEEGKIILSGGMCH